MCASALLERPLEPLPMWSTGRKPSPSTWNLPTTVLTSHVHVLPVLLLLLSLNSSFLPTWFWLCPGELCSGRHPGAEITASDPRESHRAYCSIVQLSSLTHLYMCTEHDLGSHGLSMPGVLGLQLVHSKMLPSGGARATPQVTISGFEGNFTPPFLLKLWKASTSFHLGGS